MSFTFIDPVHALQAQQMQAVALQRSGMWMQQGYHQHILIDINEYPNLEAGIVKPGDPPKDPFSKLKEQPKETKEKKKMNMIRSYVDKHRDVIFTLGVALLVDHFVLGGVLRSRIQKVIEAALSRIEKALGVTHEA